MICKNCGENTRGKYCHTCGQKTDTHRLTLKHFLAHDLVHGLFHLDQGLPKTIWAILTHPGQVALDYIFGKRKRYYNFFYLLLLIIGLYLFLLSFADSSKEAGKIIDGKKMDFTIFYKHYRKAVIFSWIPILTIAASMVFRRLKLSIIEFTIPASIAVIGSSSFNLLLTAANQFLPDSSSIALIALDDFLNLFLTLSVFLFPLFTFMTFIKGNYTTLGKIWRLSLFYLIAIIISGLTLTALVLVLSGGKATDIHVG